jgi:hypothetical protein
MTDEERQFLGEFAQRLLEKLEPLPEDFQKILYDNLWDLYERSE